MIFFLEIKVTQYFSNMMLCSSAGLPLKTYMNIYGIVIGSIDRETSYGE